MQQNARRGRLSLVPTAKAAGLPAGAAPAQGIPPDNTALSSPLLRDSYAATAFAEVLDRSLHAAMARFTVGVAPMTLIGAYADWAAHLSYSPGKQLQLGEKALRKWLRLVGDAWKTEVARRAACWKAVDFAWCERACNKSRGNLAVIQPTR
jgi:hypothetical protein